MRRFVALLIILATLTTTAFVRAEDWTLANGNTYKNVVIIKQEEDGVRVMYDGGVGEFPYYELSDDLLRRLGQDPAAIAVKRAAMLKKQAADALKAQQDAAAAADLKKQQDDAAAELKKEQQEAAAAANAAQQANQPQSNNSASTQNPATTPGQTQSTPSQPGQPQNPSHPSTSASATQAPAPAYTPTAPPPIHPAPAAGTANSSQTPVEQQQSYYPNSKFQYNEDLDLNYLDSPVIAIMPIIVDADPAAAPASPASLYLRIVTEGQVAQTPKEVEGVFFSSVPLKGLDTNKKVSFLVDGNYIPTTPPTEPVDATTSAQTSAQVTFVLTAEHMKTLLNGKQVNVSVGGYDYRIDDSGLATFQAFLYDINHLPPASTDMVRDYHRFVNRLPSIITMISTACEYIILGSFVLVMMAAVAAFVMGLTRFIKM